MRVLILPLLCLTASPVLGSIRAEHITKRLSVHARQNGVAVPPFTSSLVPIAALSTTSSSGSGMTSSAILHGADGSDGNTEISISTSCAGDCKAYEGILYKCNSAKDTKPSCLCSNDAFDAMIKCYTCYPPDTSSYLGGVKGMIEDAKGQCLDQGVTITVDAAHLPTTTSSPGTLTPSSVNGTDIANLPSNVIEAQRTNFNMGESGATSMPVNVASSARLQCLTVDMVSTLSLLIVAVALAKT